MMGEDTEEFDVAVLLASRDEDVGLEEGEAEENEFDSFLSFRDFERL